MAIELGLVGTKTIKVTSRDTAPHVPVFSTPALVQLFEQTCTSAIKDSLPADTTHVGFEVNDSFAQLRVGLVRCYSCTRMERFPGLKSDTVSMQRTH